MPSAPQEPGRQDISFVRGDDWGIEWDFAESVSGKTFTGGLYSIVTGALVLSIPCSVIDAAAGRVNLSLTAAQTASIPSGTYYFRMAWNPPSRRAYAGFAEVLP